MESMNFSFDGTPTDMSEGSMGERHDGSEQRFECGDVTQKCFSQIQTKKFWAPLMPTTSRLCPSMDLVILGMQTPSNTSTASSLWLHRTVSWQRLSTLTNFDGNDTEDQGVTHVAWSPDGRKFALALSNGDIALYHVEAIVSSSGQSMSGDPSDMGLLCTVPVGKQGIVGLTWAHGGRNHPRWELTDEEEEEEVFWSYRCRYLDRASDLLPPSEHTLNNPHHSHEHHRIENNVNENSTALPTCKTPLSILCVSTKGTGLHVYLHGRYRILTLPMIAQRNVNVVSSSDLIHLLVHQEKSMNLSLFSIPALYKHRYNLQIISSLYCSISSHMEAIKKHTPEILNSWKVSIKPLDTKMDTLLRLLKDYGVNQDIRTVLVQYILVGHTSVSSDLSNAIDQFFTGVQMNDQLVTRMERSLQAAIANVETTARSFVLGPARALVFHAGEMLGLSQQVSLLLSAKAAQQMHDSLAVLLTTVEYTLTQLVEARFRLRDFVAWLRSTGSEVKARGTAPNSAQRENAKKRRVPKTTVERVLRYMQSEAYNSTSITESILGIPLTELLNDTTNFVHGRARSPTAVADVAQAFERNTPTLLFASKLAAKAMSEVFKFPRDFMTRSVSRLDLFLPVERRTEFLPVAIHSRVGKGNESTFNNYDVEDNLEEDGFFSPVVLPGKSIPDISCCDCRNWSIIAKTISPNEGRQNYSIKLYLIPQGLADERDDSDDENFQRNGIPFYLTAEMLLPESHRVLDLQFYGDDGASALDTGTGLERRQRLGLVTASTDPNSSSNENMDLWLLPYSNLTFQLVAAKRDSKQIFLDDSNIHAQCQRFVRPQSPDEDEEQAGVLYAKTRRIGSLDSENAPHTTSSRLLLSGSRGIGGVFTSLQGVTTLDLFDLEEDEDENESEIDEESMST